MRLLVIIMAVFALLLTLELAGMFLSWINNYWRHSNGGAAQIASHGVNAIANTSNQVNRGAASGD